MVSSDCTPNLHKNFSNSAYAQHLISHYHYLDHTEDVMDIIFTTHEGRHLDTFFYVLLTVYLSIILVINQLDAQNLLL